MIATKSFWIFLFMGLVLATWAFERELTEAEFQEFDEDEARSFIDTNSKGQKRCNCTEDKTLTCYVRYRPWVKWGDKHEVIFAFKILDNGNMYFRVTHDAKELIKKEMPLDKTHKFCKDFEKVKNVCVYASAQSSKDKGLTLCVGAGASMVQFEKIYCMNNAHKKLGFKCDN